MLLLEETDKKFGDATHYCEAYLKPTRSIKQKCRYETRMGENIVKYTFRYGNLKDDEK